jgi:predicted PurR-regulated permease PerM
MFRRLHPAGVWVEAETMQRRSQLIFLTLISAVFMPFAFRIAQPFFTALSLAAVAAVLLEPVRAWWLGRLTSARQPWLQQLLPPLLSSPFSGP